MPYKKLKQKPVETCGGYKQSQITDFFRKSVPVVNRKFFIDESAKSKMPVYKGKFIDTNSDDDFDLAAKKLLSKFTKIPVDEKTDRKRKVKSLGATNLKRDLIDKDIGTLTALELNKASANPEEILTVSTAALKTNNFGGSQVRDQLPKSVDENILENFTLTPKKTNKSGFVPADSKETLESSSKRIKFDITLPGVSSLKDVVITIAGSSNQDIPPHYVLREDCTASSQTKGVTVQTPSSPLKTSPKTNIWSSPITKKTNGTPKHLKKGIDSNSVIELKPEEESEKLNVTHLELLKKLFEETLKNNNKRELLTSVDIEVIEEFLKMDVNHQYFLIKLFSSYLPTWYDMIKFCNKIKLDQKLSLKELITMYEYHKNRSFLYTDLTYLDLDELLNLLMLGDLRQIAVDFKICKKKCGTKTNIINYLKQNCKVQSTLTMKKSSEDILKEAAQKHLKYFIKLREDIKSSFDKVYVLQTCTNSSYCMDIKNYFKDVSYTKVVYPNYSVENYTPFENKEQFLRFYEALEINKAVNVASENKNMVDMKTLCDDAFKKLQSIDDDGKWSRHLPDYLQKFSAEYRYISILKSGIKKLTKFFEDVKVWLEFLIEHYPTNNSIGFWYKQLAHITLHNYKNYESAAQIVIEAFEFNKKENLFDLLQIYELNKIANKIRTTKSYKVCNLYCYKLSALTDLPVDINTFPRKFIKGCTDRSGTPGKRIYSYRDSNNEVTYGSVEAIALRYYSDKEEYKGIHCEGSFIAILFALFFWDIIYEYYVPMTFISKLQSVPLDMYSDSFYERRKEKINSRLKEIASEWPEEKLETILEENWTNNSHKKCITDFSSLDKGLKDILIMFHCIDRRVLSEILGRLVTNYKRFRSGLPDLFLWNVELSKCKFVEVKGENDSLQPNQILWIKHLIEVGAEVEVCHVSGVGAKKVMTEDDN